MTTAFAYSDINCPFCFALNERLESYGLTDVISWRAVEHMPDISGSDTSADALYQITCEVEAL